MKDAKTPAPPSPPAAKLRTPHPLERFLGQRVVLQLVHGSSIIEGTLREVRDGTAFLEGCAVRGSRHTVTTSALVLYLRGNVSHVHSVPTTIERHATTDVTQNIAR